MGKPRTLNLPEICLKSCFWLELYTLREAIFADLAERSGPSNLSVSHAMTDSTTVIIVRHGETEWNVADREMGHLDSPLTALGRIQGRRLGERAKKAGVDGIVASDLGRAATTASLAGEVCGLPVELDSGLREKNSGIFQGLLREERQSRYPKESADYQRIGAEYVIPGGESASAFGIRIWTSLEKITDSRSGRCTLIVTHGGALLSLFERLFDLPFGSGDRFRRPNAAWNQFTVAEGRWKLDVWGDTTHLVVG